MSVNYEIMNISLNMWNVIWRSLGVTADKERRKPTIVESKNSHFKYSYQGFKVIKTANSYHPRSVDFQVKLFNLHGAWLENLSL